MNLFRLIRRARRMPVPTPTDMAWREGFHAGWNSGLESATRDEIEPEERPDAPGVADARVMACRVLNEVRMRPDGSMAYYDRTVEGYEAEISRRNPLHVSTCRFDYCLGQVTTARG